MGGILPPKGIKEDRHVDHRSHDLPRRRTDPSEAFASHDAAGAEARSGTRHHSVGTDADRPLGHVLGGDGGDGRGSADQRRDYYREEALRLHRRQQLLRGPHSSHRVKEKSKSLLWVLIAAATGEAGRQGARILLRVVMRLLR